MAQGSRIWWSQWSQCFHHLMFSLITSLRLTKWSAMRIRNDSLDDSLVDVLAFTVFISKQLAGCWLQPLWKILVKWDYCSKYIIYIWEKMFQTTNQLVDHWLISSQSAWWIIPSKWYHPRDVEPRIHDHKGLTVWEEPPMIGESATKIYPAW